jgi:multidrug efflux system outer membrane protein
LIYSLLGNFITPFINRNSLKANIKTSKAKQYQTLLNYEQKVLAAYIEVVNLLSKIENYQNMVAIQKQEVDILNPSIQVSNNLFNSGRADYMEVLLTQREYLDAVVELIENKLIQIQTKINLYRALGGGWK